jgi:hypothetical protein
MLKIPGMGLDSSNPGGRHCCVRQKMKIGIPGIGPSIRSLHLLILFVKIFEIDQDIFV